MKNFYLNIGDLAVSQEPVSYTCLGLGSCVGLFLYDRLTGHSGGAHIFMPNDHDINFESGKYYSVRSAMDGLLSKLWEQGNNLTTLRAKIVGGANVFKSKIEIGEQNVKKVMDELINRKIFLAATDVGGQLSRTAIFNSRSGDLTVRISLINQTKVY